MKGTGCKVQDAGMAMKMAKVAKVAKVSTFLQVGVRDWRARGGLEARAPIRSVRVWHAGVKLAVFLVRG